jgi:hypothetical protein
MQDYQFFSLVGMIAGGFWWMISWLRSIDTRLNGLENRVSVLETRMGFIERLLEMMGMPTKISYKDRTDP